MRHSGFSGSKHNQGCGWTGATRGSPLLVGMGKQAFYAQLDLDQAAAYSYATELMASSGTMADPQERILAFIEKRKPKWAR